MNRFERLIYDRLKRNPRAKLMVRNLYQAMCDVLPVAACQTAYPITAREGYFFGFHDHTPFCADNRRLLANNYTIGLRMPGPDDELGVGYFDGDGFTTWRPVGTTRTWNWHQGCKLQWRGALPQLIYNDVGPDRFIARIHDLTTGQAREIPHPIGSVSADGRWAVGFSYERVQRYMPGYGYLQRRGEPQLDHKRPEGSGLYLLDLEHGTRRDLLSIAEVAAFQPEPGSEDAWHYVNHTVFAPSGTRIAFLHRWVTRDTRRRRTRMLTCNRDGGDWHLFPTREMVSHLGWRNDRQIVAYCRLRDGRDRYVLFTDQEPAQWEILGERVFASDGHPSFSADGRWLLTDTYPDRTRRAYLVLFDTATGRRHNIAYLRSPGRFATRHPQRHWCCDLHPRLDRVGRYLCFDATYTGQRALCTIDLGEPGLTRPPEALSVWT